MLQDFTTYRGIHHTVPDHVVEICLQYPCALGASKRKDEMRAEIALYHYAERFLLAANAGHIYAMLPLTSRNNLLSLNRTISLYLGKTITQAYPKHPSSAILARLPLFHSPPTTDGPETTSSPTGSLFATSASPFFPSRRISTELTGAPKRL